MTTLYVLYSPTPPPPRIAPWQLVHSGWDEFLANYESKKRKNLCPLHPAATVESFLRCGDLASEGLEQRPASGQSRQKSSNNGFFSLPGVGEDPIRTKSLGQASSIRRFPHTIP